jgi:hypothetical protein
MGNEISEKAASIGAEHGYNAATWVFDGNTTRETYAAVLKGIEEGDPMVLDNCEAPSLAFTPHAEDGYTESDLAYDLGVDISDPSSAPEFDAAGDAYRQASSQAFWDEVERAARYQVSD